MAVAGGARAARSAHHSLLMQRANSAFAWCFTDFHRPSVVLNTYRRLLLYIVGEVAFLRQGAVLFVSQGG